MTLREVPLNFLDNSYIECVFKLGALNGDDKQITNVDCTVVDGGVVVDDT